MPPAASTALITAFTSLPVNVSMSSAIVPSFCGIGWAIEARPGNLGDALTASSIRRSRESIFCWCGASDAFSRSRSRICSSACGLNSCGGAGVCAPAMPIARSHGSAADDATTRRRMLRQRGRPTARRATRARTRINLCFILSSALVDLCRRPVHAERCPARRMGPKRNCRRSRARLGVARLPCAAMYSSLAAMAIVAML